MPSPFARWRQIGSRFAHSALQRIRSIRIRLAGLPLQMRLRREQITLNRNHWTEIRIRLKTESTASHSSKSGFGPGPDLDRDRIIAQIRAETEAAGRNNVTRTAAYFHLYQQYPELHWALLAHMVSRNGGWNMTDLKGGLLPHVMNEHLVNRMFFFLERANFLIFQDAYPQLLLYRESRKRNVNCFSMLPDLHVSRFMKPFWDMFWEQKDSALLSLALIINEQYYIEDRLMQNAAMRKDVIHTLTFRLQSLLALNYVLFPFGRHTSTDRTRTPKLAGFDINHFSDVNKRISAGKRLYAILFGVPHMLDAVLQFANHTPHSGSRADYWPDRFTPNVYPVHSTSGTLGEGMIFSPPLQLAWSDVNHAAIGNKPDDWFENDRCFQHFHSWPIPNSFDATDAYTRVLTKLGAAASAGKLLADVTR